MNLTEENHTAMEPIGSKRCIIGEGPVWNRKEGQLYFVNSMDNEICVWNMASGALEVRRVEVGAAAVAFTKENRMIVSRPADGVFLLNPDGSTEPLYDTERYRIEHANDMKVGPDGRIYVGTQSAKRLGVSDRVDGKLFSIDREGRVRVLLDGLLLSNGLEWSMDEKRFYHTDSDTHTIREYEFDKASGDILFTGREVKAPGVDGFTIDRENRILAAGWGQGCIYVIDTENMRIASRVPVPVQIPTSCGFVGENMEYLAVTTALYGLGDPDAEPNAGMTFLHKPESGGRPPYLFG